MSLPNQIAKELLQNEKAAVLVGYCEGTIPGKTQTHFARTPEQAEKFIFNKNCVNNLAIYLTKQYKLPKPIGVFLKPCDIKTVIGLIQEKQIKREDVFIIGLTCEGVYSGKEELPGKCKTCTSHNPKDCDIIIGEPIAEPAPDPANKFAGLNTIESMPIDRRWDFWMKEFDKCLRCYACRQACPLCYCEQCIVDKTQPRWIESSAHPVGNLGWHLIRAFHLAGRCIGCGECERACHQNIPLGLLNMKMTKEIFEEFGYMAGVDAEAKPPLTDYKMEDDESFIR
jgi:formate dehydrogenase subunit beta